MGHPAEAISPECQLSDSTVRWQDSARNKQADDPDLRESQTKDLLRCLEMGTVVSMSSKSQIEVGGEAVSSSLIR